MERDGSTRSFPRGCVPLAAGGTSSWLGSLGRDPNIKNELTQQTSEAEQAEREVLQESSGPSADSGTAAPPARPPAPSVQPKKIELGQTTEAVIAIMGQPKDLIDLGNKKIYVYDSLKFTFIDGKLTKAE